MKPVSKPYLPNKNKLIKYIDKIYENSILTNQGPLLQELELKLCEYLDVKHVICVANGSLALQVVYKALGLKGEVITTPFSFAATSSTLLWEGLKPIFCDIDKKSFNIDIENIQKLINDKTSAILPVHVFGNPCDVEAIDFLKNKYSLKVIYDAAHAFGVRYNEQSVLNYGDASTLSFHATKLFHTIEGGAIITDNSELAEKCRALINFGIADKDLEGVGTNAKMNELEAAMGLCILDDIDNIIFKERSILAERYKVRLDGFVKFQEWSSRSNNNYAYMPIVFDNERQLLYVLESLLARGIFARRYFYPSLDEIIDCSQSQKVSISNDISKRILCLPLYPGLSIEDVDFITEIIIKGVKNEDCSCY